MISVIISFSRITILAFLLVFTLIDLIQLFEPKLGEGLSGGLNTVQTIMVVFFILNTSIILYLSTEDPAILLLLALQLILFIAIGLILNHISTPASKCLINNVLLFLSLSFVFLERLNMKFAVRQLIYAFIACIIATAIVLIIKQVDNMDRLMFVFATIGIILLVLVLFLGKAENGAKLSFSLLGIRIQPSEFIKITYLLFISGCIVTYRDIRGFLLASFGAAIHVLVLVFSRDLGTALIFVAAYVFVFFIAYKNYIVLGLELILGTIGGILAYKMFPHIQTRFIAWTDPLSVVDDKGYQISQSLFAIGTGGWVGSGFTNGMPKKIPVVTQDFIFAAIAEELGAVAAILLIICFMCACVFIFNSAYNCKDSFYMLVVNGIGVVFSLQTILNIGGVIKFIPSTGVTLPFISYGGSSLLSMFICFFIVEASNEFTNVGRVRHAKR